MQHGTRVHVCDREGAKDRCGVGVQGVAPLLTMLGVAPACLVRRDVAVGHVRKRDAADCRLMSQRLLCQRPRLALGQRVDAVFDLPVQVHRLLARLGQGGIGNAAQPHFPHATIPAIAEQPEAGLG